jgi:hypothetical protein
LLNSIALKYGPEGLPCTLEELQRNVGPGWANLLERLVTDLESLGWNGKVLQVKQKFGGLRFYIPPSSEIIHDCISEASGESYTIWEECGAPGSLREDGWFKTLCDAHNA